MKREQFLDAMQFLDDTIIEETAAVRGKRRKHTVRAIVSLVACVALLVGGVWLYDATRLPLLEIEFTHQLAGGYSGVCCYDIASHDETNPWDSKTPIRRLPVYKNAITDANWQVTGGLSEEQMTEMAEKAADTLGFTITDVEKWQYGGKLQFIADEADILVDPYGTVNICFGGWGKTDTTRHIPLPDTYNFRGDADFAEAEKALMYLTKKYTDLLGFSQPIPYLTSTFSYSGERRYHYRVYEGADTAAERILNYACKTAHFGYDEHGNLSGITITNALAAAEKLGDYPIISADEAYELLLEGYHVSNHLRGIPLDEDTVIHKRALVYRATIDDAIILPYYVFYTEDPTTYYNVAEWLNFYNVYYVPAVDREYIKSLPLWDGTTNK